MGRVRGRVRDFVSAGLDRAARRELAAVARFTPLVAGALVATFISVESPLSGMSMNPARTFRRRRCHRGSGPRSGSTSLAPPLAMLAAGAVLPALARRPTRLLRQVSPPQQQAVHLPLQLSEHFSNEQ